ncbi:MAG: DUF3631 domain-containing protein [Fimbriimonadales bacterium]
MVLAYNQDTWGTVEDRSIIIPMVRKTGDERVKKFRPRHDSGRFKDACRKVARWVHDNLDSLRLDCEGLPDNRAGDVWEPLASVADAAGGRWPALARNCASTMAGEEDTVQTLENKLIEDIHEIFKTDSIFSRTLCEKLNSLEESPWSSANRGREINQNWLAGKLNGYGIKPATIREGDETAKGYKLAGFADAFRYLPSSCLETPFQSVTTSQTNGMNSVGRVEHEMNSESVTLALPDTGASAPQTSQNPDTIRTPIALDEPMRTVCDGVTLGEGVFGEEDDNGSSEL